MMIYETTDELSFQPDTDFNAVLIWARVNLGMASAYRAAMPLVTSKLSRQRETEVNPVEQDGSDQRGLECGRGETDSRSAAPIENPVRSP